MGMTKVVDLIFHFWPLLDDFEAISRCRRRPLKRDTVESVAISRSS